MFATLALYFGCGLVYEVLVTAYYRFVSRGRPVAASMVTMAVTLFGFWVLDRVVGGGMMWAEAVAYALGNGVGCALIVRRRT